MKACTKCGTEKELKYFYKNSRAADGLTWQCKDCHNAANADWIDRNRKQYNSLRRVYTARRREKQRKN